LCFVQDMRYRDKKVVDVFLLRFRARFMHIPVQHALSENQGSGLRLWGSCCRRAYVRIVHNRSGDTANHKARAARIARPAAQKRSHAARATTHIVTSAVWNCTQQRKTMVSSVSMLTVRRLARTHL
jgi:hypothetical protein